MCWIMSRKSVSDSAAQPKSSNRHKNVVSYLIMAESSSSSSGFSLFAVVGIVWASIVSWTIVPSVGWTILHGLFGWFYLLAHWLGIHA